MPQLPNVTRTQTRLGLRGRAHQKGEHSVVCPDLRTARPSQVAYHGGKKLCQSYVLFIFAMRQHRDTAPGSGHALPQPSDVFDSLPSARRGKMKLSGLGFWHFVS